MLRRYLCKFLPDYLTACFNPTRAQLWHLTSLVGGDSDGGVLPHLRSQRRHSVLCFDLKSVVSVGQEVSDGHRGVLEAHRPGQEAHVAAARLTELVQPTATTAAAASGGAAAALADDGEGDVPAPAVVLRPAPVQDNRSLVDGGYHVPGS